MAIQSSLTQEVGEKKKPQLDCTSPQSSLTQGDSDSESTSVSSSMQGSISSATSSLDRYSSNIKEETRQKKPPNKSISRKLTTSGSFMTSRRPTRSKLSQSSIRLLDHGSTTPPPSSSVEVSDESSNYVQKPMPKFTRTGSLRSVKIFRSNSKNRNKNKNKNKSDYKSKKSSTNNFSQISEESHLERATFSSILKDSKFPDQLKHQSGPSEAKICPYQHCSLHGHHHHHHKPPKKRFPYLKKRTTIDKNIMKPESQPTYKSSSKKLEVKGTKMGSKDDDFSIEFYAKTRFEPLSSHDHGDAELADILFGVSNFQENKNITPVADNRDFTDFSDLTVEKDENSNGSKRVVEKKQSLKKTRRINMWRMIHQHMVSGLADEQGDMIVHQQVDEETKSETKSETKEFDDDANQETEIRKMFAIKLVRDAIERILLPEVQDDQSTTSEVVSEQDLSERSEITSDHKPESLAEKSGTKKSNGAPNRWSYLKKVVLLKRFVKELEKVKKFDPKKDQHLPLPPEPGTETVSLRQQTAGDKKRSDEWMLDYALQKVVSELAPTQKRKVALLVKAFETVAPAQDDPPESRSNVEIQWVGSEDSEPIGKVQENSDSKSGLEKEEHIKMWHMIYQHVVTDIATKMRSELLLDGEESTSSEEKNLQEVEDQTERSYRLQFTQTDAVKLVRESVNEILLPDDTKKDNDGSTTKLQQQKSKNWGKLKNLIMLKRSIKALEGFRKLKPQTTQREVSKSDQEQEKVDLRRQMIEERKKAEQWMLDYAVQHIVTKLTPARRHRVSMLVEAFEAVVPFPEV